MYKQIKLMVKKVNVQSHVDIKAIRAQLVMNIDRVYCPSVRLLNFTDYRQGHMSWNEIIYIVIIDVIMYDVIIVSDSSSSSSISSI